MRSFAAVSLIVALAAGGANPTASPFPECPVGITITAPTLAPTLAPTQSPSAPPTMPPTASPTSSPSKSPTAGPVPVTPPPGVEWTPSPRPLVENGWWNGSLGGGVPAWGNESHEGMCRCDTFGRDTQPFLDRNDTYCGNKAGMLAAWEGAVHFTCPHCVQSGTAINITCPNNWETCEMLLNLYVCPGCSSSGGRTTTGMWPSSLAMDGWTAAGRCTGSFCDSEGRQHPLVGFHKQILGGDTEMIPETASEAMYFSLLVKEGKVCDQITDQGDCTAAPLCRWSTAGNSSCYMDWCPPVGGGTKRGFFPPKCAAACAPGTPDGVCQS